MSGSIRDLAAFRTEDVFQLLRAPVEPEKLVLASYTFLPYVRNGVAATLTDPFAFNLPWRPQIEASLPVIADDGPLGASVKLSVRGPGDVLGLDTRQVIRTHPQHDKHDAETEDLVHIEFDRPDLPWLFTPTGPDGNGRLWPWITLVVVEQGFAPGPAEHGRLPELDVPRDQLPSLQDAWAWAHAQVMGTKSDPPSIADRLDDVNPTLNLSRLMCPLHLQPDTAYVACVVPTFKAGSDAGLRLPISTQLLDPAWTDQDLRVKVPVYYSWRFSTTAFGNFAELARRIEPAPAPPGVGRRRLDTSRPGTGVDDLLDGDAGREQVIVGPVVSINDPAPGEYPSEDEQRWPEHNTEQLSDELAATDVQLRAPKLPRFPAALVPQEQPEVGPPLYAGNHAARVRVDDTAPAWFAELNLEPRHRVVAGLGTRIVQMDQEALMASAWNQVGAIEQANRTIRLAQLARYVAASIHRRHLQPLTPAALLSVTQRVHTRILDTPGVTVHARLGGSSLSLAATTTNFRRFTRLRGPNVRFNRDRGIVERLIADPAGITRDWRRAYTPPDGVRGLSPAAIAVVGEAAVRQALGVVDPTVSVVDALAHRASVMSSTPSLPDALTPHNVAQLPPPPTEQVALAVASSVLQSLLQTSPTLDQMRADPRVAFAGAGKAVQLRSFVEVQASVRRSWPVDGVDAQRLGLEDPAGGVSSEVSDQALMSYADQADALGQQFGLNIDLDLLLERSQADSLAQLVKSIQAVEPAQVQQGLFEVAAGLFAEDTPAEPDRAAVSVASLLLIDKLEPALTITNRIKGRLRASAQRLAPDWFADGRVEPVMAAPRFPFPTYEPLYRYDKNWLIPGLSLIDQTDMVTLLVTNSSFVETYLIGLNHEMARELLWRGYPTDQRGTYFRSFWTTRDELQQPLHALADGHLGDHIDPTLTGRVVMLVRGELIRRYPGVVAHVAQQVGQLVNGIPSFAAADPAPVLFRIFLEPNILLVGFDITADHAKQPGEWFLLSENPTEPRFGLHDNQGNPTDLSKRDDLAWADFGTPNGAFLRGAQPINVNVEGTTWGTDSAAAAHLLFLLPARAAYSAQSMITGAGG